MTASGPSSAAGSFSINLDDLSRLWDREHVSPADPHSLKHAELLRSLRDMTGEFQTLMHMQPVGNSVEGRTIYLVSLGTGNKKILLWSQMHGDEPTATSAILDLLHFFGKRQGDPWVAEILHKYSLLFIPMLNPDGAERNQRRNAQSIDINRDALALQTAEGRVLKNVRDRFEPFLGFNLHNQNSLTTVGDTGKVATIALLAVGADQASGKAATQKGDLKSTAVPLSKQIASVICEALSPFIDGHISRYDESYNPRAFGDNIALWGTPVVLIESGGIPAGQAANLTVRLNFLGLLAAFNSLASEKFSQADPIVYESLKVNSDSPIFDLLLRNAWICTGTGVPVFQGDIAIRHELRAGMPDESIIADLGDLRIASAHQTLDCTNALVTPGLIGYEPDGAAFAANRSDSRYLSAGILTLLTAARWDDLSRITPEAESWKKVLRLLNWGFVVAGDPGSRDLNGVFELASWLAAGSRAWVRGPAKHLKNSERLGKIADWLGVAILSAEESRRYGVPRIEDLKGNPAKLLPRWTSEAARRFRLPRRGVITPGAIADLVIWQQSTPGEPADLSTCKPIRGILNGHELDLGSPGTQAFGRFLGR